MEQLIFGFTWEEIQQMQQKQYQRPTISGPVHRKHATKEDFELLKKHGEDGLRKLQFFGVLDRIQYNINNIEETKELNP